MFNKYKIEYFLFIFLGRLFTLFGFSSIHKTAKFIAFLFFRVLRIRRDIVISNLKIAFPHLNHSEIVNLANKNYQSIAVTFLEVFSLSRLNVESIKKRFSNDGFDLIKEKYKEGNGLILLTAHFGNWEIGAIASGLHMNEGINVLVKKQKNPYVSQWLNNFRERFGNSQVYLGTSIRELYTTIRNKKIVGIVGDQRGKRDGIKVNFFGRETSTFPGTASIAIKTKCPVYVLLCARQKDNTYKAIIEEIDHSQFIGNQEEKVKKFNQEYMSLLEKNISKYPEQWFWMHNIWKY